MKFALLIHSYYYNETLSLISKMNWINNVKPDILISYSEDLAESEISEILKSFGSLKIVSKKVKNFGFDIAGLTTHFNKELQDYELVLKVHSKKSKHNEKLNDWVDDIYNCILSNARVVEIFKLFEELPSLGIIGPAPFYKIRNFLGWGANFKLARKISNFMHFDIKEGSLDYFPAGSMFWFRPAALKGLLNINISEGMYRATEIGNKYLQLNDGTLAHAIERMFGIVSNMHGFKVGYYRSAKEVDALYRQLELDYVDLDYYNQVRGSAFQDKKNALLDYLKVGESLSFSVNKYFVVKDYLDLNNDLNKFENPPLFHYHNYGAAEDRLFNKNINNKYCRSLNSIKNSESMLLELLRNKESIATRSDIGYPLSVRAISADSYNKSISRSQFENSKSFDSLVDYIKSFSSLNITLAHRDPFVTTGGAEKFLLEQVNGLNKYLLIWPLDPSNMIALGNIGYYAVRVSGVPHFFQISHIQLLSIINLLKLENLYMNHIMGFGFEILIEIFSRVTKSICFYQHDYYICCPQAHFMFNGVESCKGPVLNAEICNYCQFGVARNVNNEVVEKIFAYLKNLEEKIDIRYIVNSNFSKEIINKLIPTIKAPLEIVEPLHVSLVKNLSKNNNLGEVGSGPRLKKILCYAGLPVNHKGFDDFLSLSNELGDRYDFVVITSDVSSNINSGPNIRWVLLNSDEVIKDGLERVCPDVVLALSKCYESYSISTMEALSLGIPIFAYKDSGNIVNLVRNYNNGLIFDDYSSLVQQLKSLDTELPKISNLKYNISFSRLF